MKRAKVNRQWSKTTPRLALALAGACVLTGVGITTEPQPKLVLEPQVAQAQQVRRVLARDLTVFNHYMQPIATLYCGETFVVDRYTGGGHGDGVHRWAIGRAYGCAANGVYGRVLVQYLG